MHISRHFLLFHSVANEYLKAYNKTSAISNAQDLATEHINKALEIARDCVRESLDKQAELLSDIQKTYEDIFGKQKNDATVLTTLILAAEAYEQLLQDVGQGITFYADLTGILVKFQNKVRSSHLFHCFFSWLFNNLICGFLGN